MHGLVPVDGDAHCGRVSTQDARNLLEGGESGAGRMPGDHGACSGQMTVAGDGEDVVLIDTKFATGPVNELVDGFEGKRLAAALGNGTLERVAAHDPDRWVQGENGVLRVVGIDEFGI